MDREITHLANGIQLDGRAETAGGQSIVTLLKDASGDILFATGATLPTNSSAGFAKGCIFIDTDVAGGTGGVYFNKGTTTSCTFTLVTQA